MTETTPPPDSLDDVIARIQKLLNLAAKNSSQHEAAAALAKAQQLMTQHNLDTATVENAKSGDGKREQANVEGGFYSFQREMWKAIAELNFCLHWMQSYNAENQPANVRDRYGAYIGKQIKTIVRKRHALVGRTVNVRATVAMAQYLQGAIERTLRETLSEGNREHNLRSLWAWSFRKGCAEQIIEKIKDRRYKVLEEEEKKRRKAERAAKRAASGASTSTALTLSSLIQQEEDANNDFLFGEGFSAERAAERASRARRRREAQDNYTQWAAAHPKEAASAWEWTDDEGTTWTQNRRGGGRGSRGGGRSSNVDHSAYYAGYDAGNKIGLDPQVDAGGFKKIAGKK